jgi:protein O-mannosyl-transferase
MARARRNNRRHTCTPSAEVAPRWLRWAIVVVIVTATAATLWPVLRNQFVWDDYPLFVENPYVHGLDAEQVTWMFTSLDTGHYHPLSWLLIGAIAAITGLDPSAYHAVGLALHVVNTLLVYALARRLIALACRRPGSDTTVAIVLAGGLAAMAFALHPLRVEVVAWAIALRDLLCATFFLATLLCYVRAQESGRRGLWYWASVVSCALALLAKPMAVSLPILILVLDVYPLRRLQGGVGDWLRPPGRRVLIAKIPFVLLAGAASAVAPLAESKAGALMSLEQFGPVQRLAQAVYGLTFYLVKTVLPTGLSPLYELPHDLNPAEVRFLASGVAVAAITAVVVALRRRVPSLLAVWICYVIVLLPVLGFVHIGPFIAADRYTYLPMVAWATVAGGGALVWLRGEPGERTVRRRGTVVLGVSAMILVAWAMLSHRQAEVWRNELTLWDHARTIEPRSRIARGNYAAALAKHGHLDEAWAAYMELLKLTGGHPTAVHGLGWVRHMPGREKEAIRYYRMAVKVIPRSAELHVDLADALTAIGQTQEAVKHYRRALEIWPSHKRAIDGLRELTTSGPTTRSATPAGS